MKIIVRILVPIAFLLNVSFNSLAIAGEYCDGLSFVCPGVMCWPQQVACKEELEQEARLRDYEERMEIKEIEKRMAIKQQKETQPKFPMPANAEPDSYASQGWSCRVGFRQVGGYCTKDASMRERTLTKRQQKNDISPSDPTLPANAEADSYASQGWSCRVGFHQVGLTCKKNM